MWSNKSSLIFAKVIVTINTLYYTIWIMINNFSKVKTENIFMYGTFIPYTISLTMSILLVTASLLSIVVFYKKQSNSSMILIPIQLLFVSSYFYHYIHLIRI
jgi:hypothetical protein